MLKTVDGVGFGVSTLTIRAMLAYSVCGLAAVAVAGAQAGVPIVGAAVVVPRATQYDITSKINGLTYRVMVSTPFGADPAVAYPVLYVLDGNEYFAAASDNLTRQAELKVVEPAIVVGIGYPTDDPTEVSRRRRIDLTPTASKREDAAAVRTTGGADVFLRVIEEEVKPLVAARYKVDAAQQIFYGQSLGGLTVLRSMLRNPTAFSTYILSSPSIWWDEKVVLGDEGEFAKRAKAGELHIKVMVTSAGDEQKAGSKDRMVDNASELAVSLSGLSPKNIQVVRTIFPGEVHATVPMLSLNRALRFALGTK